MLTEFEDEIIPSPDPCKFLSIAKEFEKAGVVSYAIDVYTKIIDEYPDTFEAVASRFALFLITSRYEENGEKELAISLMKRLHN